MIKSSASYESEKLIVVFGLSTVETLSTVSVVESTVSNIESTVIDPSDDDVNPVLSNSPLTIITMSYILCADTGIVKLSIKSLPINVLLYN